MKKLLLIPTLVTTSLAPLVAFTSCSCGGQTKNTYFIFSREERASGTLGKVVNLSGHCQSSSSELVIISEACHFLNLEHRNMETGEVETYDEDLIDIKASAEKSVEHDFSYDITLNLTHKEEFPEGEFFFDFVFVWFENGDYLHIYEQTVYDFFIYRIPTPLFYESN